jgi:hypothetical protein
VDKYIIDNGGLKDNIVVFVIYGKSGDQNMQEQSPML